MSAARLRYLAEKATSEPWRDRREPSPVKNVWFDSAPNESTPIESTGTAFALGVAVAACVLPNDAALIVHLRNRAQLYADLIESAAAYRDSVSVNIDKTGRLDAQASYAALRRVEAALAAIDAADKEGV